MLRRGVFGLALVIGLVAAVGLSHAAADAPLTTETDFIGRSVEGRRIDVTCVGDGALRVLVVSGMHTGNEANTVDLAREFTRRMLRQQVDIPSDITLCILPVLNPDGLADGTHTNARRVDLNRNWPSSDWNRRAYHSSTGSVSGGAKPLSEPETKALYEYIEETRPVLVMVWHCCAALVEANEVRSAERLARIYAHAADFYYLETWHLYNITGQFLDAMDRIDVPVIDVELRAMYRIDIDDHVAGVRAVLDAISDD